MTKFKINQNDSNQTIFNFIKKTFKDTSLSVIYKLFRKGKIKVNNKKCKDTKQFLYENDEIIIFDTMSSTKRERVKFLEKFDIDVIFEDNNIIIVDKPTGVEVHSEFNISMDLIVKSYLFKNSSYNPDNENSFAVSHAHRIDKTSRGLLIYAKNKKSLDSLHEAFRSENSITKLYICKLENQFKGPNIIDGYMHYNEQYQKCIFSLDDKGFAKIAKMEIVDNNAEENIVTVKLITGRKHQIRSTMSYFKCPIINDFKYGAKKEFDINGISLVSKKIIFKNLNDSLSYLNGREFESNYNL